ncbi:hypothetical protein PSHT_10044 [Puccinia striiformis]|uniref:Uncharacterized protein n=1 Tax=Puccinia striiformis TaxID=27350 RepID=A0A2S4VCJ7_9BASI|nr:hypothetical protein PSHT_10044 [Puccinia striiformis]
MKFQTIFAFMNRPDVWNYGGVILMDYGWFLMKRTTFNQAVPPEVWKETSASLWEQLMEELPNYMRISHRMDQDPKWEAILGKNLYVHGFKWHWDYEIQTLGGYLDDFLALARVKRGHSIDLPPSYYLYDPPRTS